MFNINAGERSPRVTLLQILLNSHACTGSDGKRLTVDGVYGHNTGAAVTTAGKMTGTGGAATPALIRQLLADVDLRVITSVDLGDPRLQADVDRFQRSFDDPIVLGGMCNGLGQMVQEVSTRARPGRVAALRFDGHGNLGEWLTVSVGNVADLRESKILAERREYAEIAKETYSYISAENFNMVAGIVQPLSAIFAPFGFAEHLGCTLGRRPNTQKMLRKLADLWGVPIRVGVNLQTVGSIEISGPIFTAFPRGLDLMHWSRQFQTLDLAGRSISTVR